MYCSILAGCAECLLDIQTIFNEYRSLSVGVLKVLGTHMSSRETAKMGDILATEADLLGMIKEVTN